MSGWIRPSARPLFAVTAGRAVLDFHRVTKASSPYGGSPRTSLLREEDRSFSEDGLSVDAFPRSVEEGRKDNGCCSVRDPGGPGPVARGAEAAVLGEHHAQDLRGPFG